MALYTREVGSGPPIVVVHGGPDFDHEYLLPEMDRLARRFRLVYYDQRGRGRSFAGEGPDDVTIESEVADLDQVQAAHGLEAVAVLGHSWGALIAMEYAARRPERVTGLIVMNTAPVSPADLPALREHLQSIRRPEAVARMTALAADPRYQAGDIEADAEFHRLHFEGMVRDPAVLERLVGRLRAGFTPEGIVAARAIERRLFEQTWLADDYDLLDRLGSGKVPTLVLHGDRDLIPLDVAQRVAAAVPGARLTVLPDCGHFAFIDRPDAVEAELVAFMRSGGPTTR